MTLHVEDSASCLDGRQQGVLPGAQLDELCLGAGLGVLGGAKLWLGDGVGIGPLARCHSLGREMLRCVPAINCEPIYP